MYVVVLLVFGSVLMTGRIVGTGEAVGKIISERSDFYIVYVLVSGDKQSLHQQEFIFTQ